MPVSLPFIFVLINKQNNVKFHPSGRVLTSLKTPRKSSISEFFESDKCFVMYAYDSATF